MFSIDNTVMLLIDVQGNLANLMHRKDALFSSLSTLIQGMTILGIPIIWMEQLPDKLGPTAPQLSCLLPDKTPIAKHTFSCCGNAGFLGEFSRLDRHQVLATGIETHICVYQTCMDLLQTGNQVQVVADCVSSRTEANRKIGLKRIIEAGGKVTSVEMILFELMKEAGGDAFKQIIRIIK
ncbi:MAG: hydrolase [Pseudomonadota bacterium]